MQIEVRLDDSCPEPKDDKITLIEQAETNGKEGERQTPLPFLLFRSP